jgi:hypothetical protein
MFDRRHFLIGAGALLTASFVRRATAFSRKAGEPLILPLARKPDETLYVYKDWSEEADWRVSLGPDQPEGRRLRSGGSICVPLGIASRRKTTSSASAMNAICFPKSLTPA